ncbi:MAG: dTDP-4-dehydrorhamnose reductase [Cyclobacteriaceae bacterium]|nr:dTDP-4-dehydrorhamnose reductase [Cyclobacteriaceae bacterium]
MKILVTGSKGQLGSELQSLAVNASHQFDFTDIEELNITEESEIDEYSRKYPFDILINCAAYTAVDLVEKEIDKALLINSTAPGLLAERSRLINASIIHISTDFVFDGSASRPYVENDPVAPVNAYGQTKCEGELNVLKGNPKSIVIRTSWLYSQYGNNFVKTMIRLGQSRDEIGVIFDQVGSPTYAYDLAKVIMEMVDILENEKENSDKWGIYHFSNEGVASWYDFAYEIFMLKNIKLKLKPILTRDYPTPARRPHFSVMDKSKIKSVFGIQIPHWKESLGECIARMD